MARLVATTGRARISPRENEVLQLVGQALSNKEIASRLGIAVSTVNQHVRSLLLKLGAPNRTRLAVIAVRPGLIGRINRQNQIAC